LDLFREWIQHGQTLHEISANREGRLEWPLPRIPSSDNVKVRSKQVNASLQMGKLVLLKQWRRSRQDCFRVIADLKKEP